MGSIKEAQCNSCTHRFKIINKENFTAYVRVCTLCGEQRKIPRFPPQDFANKQMSNENLNAHIGHQLGRWLSQGRDFSDKEIQLINQITNRCNECLGEMVDSSNTAAINRCPMCKSSDINELGVIANLD